jgi:hypothetical protein
MICRLHSAHRKLPSKENPYFVFWLTQIQIKKKLAKELRTVQCASRDLSVPRQYLNNNICTFSTFYSSGTLTVIKIEDKSQIAFNINCGFCPNQGLSKDIPFRINLVIMCYDGPPLNNG